MMTVTIQFASGVASRYISHGLCMPGVDFPISQLRDLAPDADGRMNAKRIVSRLEVSVRLIHTASSGPDL